jgi:hypothetical protein
MIRKCNSCRFLVDDLAREHAEFYVRCGWWDGRSLPITTQSHWTRPKDTTSWITRKVVFTENAARLTECPAHEPRQQPENAGRERDDA